MYKVNKDNNCIAGSINRHMWKKWSLDMKRLLLFINKLNVFETSETLDINEAGDLLTKEMYEKWKN